MPTDDDSSALPADPDPELLDALKRWREEIADEAGVPAYYILTNDTLVELARHRPADRETLLSIRGIGPAKAVRYGATLLEIVDGGGGGRRTGDGGREDESDGRGVGTSVPTEKAEPSALYDQPEIRNQKSEIRNSDPPALRLPSPAPDSRYWTRRLLSAGFSIEECMAIRGLPRETIEAHAR